MTAVPPLPLHLGSLHGYELVLLAILAFGPFVVLALVGVVNRSRGVGPGAAEPPQAGSSVERPDTRA